MIQQEMTLARWLFNPFVRVAGANSLAAGLAVIVLGGLAAAGAGIRFDGLLDMHFVHAVPVSLPILEGLLNWVVITILLALVARLFGGGSGVRLIDIAGTQALARAPLVLAAGICALPWIQNSLAEMSSALQSGAFDALGPGALVGSLAMLAGIGWMVALMWNAFRISCNMKGGRAVALFIGAVVVGELVTKSLVLRYL